MYKKIFNEGKSYKIAVNEVKREFIQGKYNEGFDISHPNYWAAFTYFGE
jgi:CHAT domain-containing protein